MNYITYSLHTVASAVRSRSQLAVLLSLVYSAFTCPTFGRRLDRTTDYRRWFFVVGLDGPRGRDTTERHGRRTTSVMSGELVNGKLSKLEIEMDRYSRLGLR